MDRGLIEGLKSWRSQERISPWWIFPPCSFRTCSDRSARLTTQGHARYQCYLYYLLRQTEHLKEGQSRPLLHRTLAWPLCLTRTPEWGPGILPHVFFSFTILFTQLLGSCQDPIPTREGHLCLASNQEGNLGLLIRTMRDRNLFPPPCPRSLRGWFQASVTSREVRTAFPHATTSAKLRVVRLSPSLRVPVVPEEGYYATTASVLMEKDSVYVCMYVQAYTYVYYVDTYACMCMYVHLLVHVCVHSYVAATLWWLGGCSATRPATEV